MRHLLTILLTGFALNIYAQTWPLTGEVFTEDNAPLVYSTVVLLSPADSTLQFYGVTNKEGRFDIKNIRKGNYLLQVAFLGYETHYQPVAVPADGNSLGRISMKSKSMAVDEVKVTGEYVPMSFRGDTTEYNAAAFQLKPDAMTEDLLKKLPGVEVDRAGNIKAMGEDVKRVMVGGKEFFGNDPKVATKNVPADAVDKVQIYDRTSEESMFTGIRDGSRERTINLELKEDKKNGIFGNVTAGGGTGEHWLGNGRAYRFTDKTQTALLGMANNVNQSGFSFDDYMNFSGGLGSMVHGGGSAQIRITSDGSFPINFGQPLSGINTSGAGGANFSYSKSPNDRAFISYMGTGSKKELEQTTNSRNYLQNSEFNQEEDLTETDKNQSHRVNFGLRTRIDSTRNLVIDGNVSVTDGDNLRLTDINSRQSGQLVNSQAYETSALADRFMGSASGSYVRKLNFGKSVWKVSGNASLNQGLTKNKIFSETSFQRDGNWEKTAIRQFQDNDNATRQGSLAATFTQKAGRLVYLEPEIRGGATTEILDRSQGLVNGNPVAIDSLSPEFQKDHTWIRPRLGLIRNTAKTRFTLALQMESGKIASHLDGEEPGTNNYTYLLPYLLYENEYQTGRRIMTQLTTQVNTPTTIQLLPVVNNINPLSVYYGNPDLKPELSHRMNLHWMIFDQFSFTSLMTTLSATYTKDKINWDRTIRDNLSFVNTMTNVDDDREARANIDFSTPLRFIGMKVRINLEERWNRGINLVNKLENTYTNHTHRASVSLDNRKKDKWDINTGIEARLTNAKYTLQSNLNNNYFDLSWFGDVRFTPNKDWNFSMNADVANYSDRSFGESISIPLLHAEASRHFLKNRRGTLTLRAFDLLDKNNIVQRLSELNYLREVRSNSIGRYFLLSFTYRLNQFGGESKGVEIRMAR
jgi:hypothetical protein